MSELSTLVAKFVASVGSQATEIYNEFSLQHEFGIFLRAETPAFKVQFERNVTHFAPSKADFTKRELDIAVFSPDKEHLKYAIELKFPRSGQHPEQMFSFCKDIAFVEELKAAGFSAAALLVFVDHHLFYRGASEGIYAYFRGGKPINGRIEKPTGAKNEYVDIRGTYTVAWVPVSSDVQYALIEV